MYTVKWSISLGVRHKQCPGFLLVNLAMWSSALKVHHLVLVFKRDSVFLPKIMEASIQVIGNLLVALPATWFRNEPMDIQEMLKRA